MAKKSNYSSLKRTKSNSLLLFWTNKCSRYPGLGSPSPPSSPHSCSQRPTASPPCASGGSYPERPCLRGGWACSRACGATAPRAPAEGARRCAAGWPGWGRGWKWCGGTSRRSTWRGRSRRSRSPDRDLEPAAGWSAGRRRSPERSDGTGSGAKGPPMDPIQMPLSAQHLQLDPRLSCPQSKMLFLVSHLAKTKSSGSTLKPVLVWFESLCCDISRAELSFSKSCI